MIRRLLIPLASALVVIGTCVLIAASGAEIALGLRGVLAGTPWPPGVLLDALVAGSALLLCVAVLITRRSMSRTARVEQALRESEERLRLVANNVPALISYLDCESRFRFSNRTYDDWFGIPQERMSTVSYGKERPVCTAETEECKNMNRRADFRIKSR